MYSKNCFYIFLILFFGCTANNVIREVIPPKRDMVTKVSVFGTLTQLNDIYPYQNLNFKIYNEEFKVLTDENGHFSLNFIYKGPSELIISYVNSIGDVRTFRKYFSTQEDLNLLINIDKNGTLKASSLK